MMKNTAKIILVFLITVLLSVTVMAEDVFDNTKLAESIESIATKLEIFARYEDVDKESLYESALLDIIKTNPELYEQALDAMLSSIDENSAYYNESETKKLLDTLTDEVTGIGVNVLMDNDNIIVTQPIPDSPADRAGIKTGDIIIGADDVDLRGMDFEKALDYIRGPVGTKVNIKIIRSGIDDVLTFTISRELVVSSPIDYELIEKDNKKIAKITVYSFTDTVFEHFSDALKQADADGTKNIIIDLRNNGGGYLAQAVKIADLFLPEGDIITTEDHKVDIFDKTYTASGKKTDYEVVVLINGMSASASEILTAALSENGKAKVIGERSFGKGTVQTIAEVDENSLIKYTTAFYLTPQGNNIHKVGIVPDAVVKNTYEPIDMSGFDMFTLSKKYMLGDTGEEIRNAKKMLEYMGIFIGEVNDVFDENLKIAVSNYQKYKGLFPYGVLDITTQYNMYEFMKEVQIEVDKQLEAAIRAF